MIFDMTKRQRAAQIEEMPDLTALPISGNYGAYITIDTTLLDETRSFKFILTNFNMSLRGRADIGKVVNGSFVSEITYQNAGTYTMVVPSGNTRYYVMKLSNTGRTGSGSTAPSLDTSSLPSPFVDVYSKRENAYTCLSGRNLWATLERFTEVCSDGAYHSSGLGERAWPYNIKELALSGTYFSGSRLFLNFCRDRRNLEKVTFSSTETTTLTASSQSDTTESMFQNCNMLKEVDLSFVDASAVTTIRNMFRSCSSLKKINMSGWNLSNCTTTSDAFNGCYSLKTIILNNAILPNASLSMASCANLTNNSLVAIANALIKDAAKTLTLHATPKAACATIVGTVDNDVFTADPNGTVTLTEFITTTKGWTIA